MGKRADRITRIAFWLVILLTVVMVAGAAWQDIVNPVTAPPKTNIYGY